MTSTIIAFDGGRAHGFLDEGEVTLERLESILTSALFGVEFDEDGHLYVKEGVDFPTFVALDITRKFVIFNTYVINSDSEETTLPLVNKMNLEIFLAQFAASNGKILGSYVLDYSGGLRIKTFVNLLRRFSGAFVAGLELDERVAEGA
jgi:hypothetical protein